MSARPDDPSRSGADTKPLVLAIDDEPSVRFLIEMLLDHERVLSLPDGRGMAAAIAAERPDLILLDVGLPELSGFDLAARLREDPQSPPFMFITAQDSVEDATRGLSLGALDYIRKPFAGAELVARVRAALARSAMARGAANGDTALTRIVREGGAVDAVLTRQAAGSDAPADPAAGGTQQPAASPARSAYAVDAERRGTVYRSIIGSSPAIEEAIALLDRAAGIDATVLLLGESGTGKELFARAFHEASGRGSGPFVPVNCAAIPRELAEGLFFGHAKGSFTGAGVDKPGWFEEARGGTLFLDEVGELPPELQGALLRAVESRRIQRLGEKGERSLDIRLVAATNRDLGEAVREGRFRADLFYRLEEIPVRLPSLAERGPDIEALVESFLAEFARLSPIGKIELGPAAMAALVARPWPGNVRELRNTIRRIVITARSRLVASLPGEPVAQAAKETAPQGTDPGRPAAADPPAPPQTATNADYSADRGHAVAGAMPISELERAAIERALADCGGDVAAAARVLGLSRATLYRRLRSYRPGAGEEA